MGLHPGEITRARIRGVNYPAEAEQIFRQELGQKSKEELVDYIISLLDGPPGQGYVTERILNYLEREDKLEGLIFNEVRDDEARMLYRDLHRDQGYY